MTDVRPTWVEYYLGIAEAVSRRADCTRRKVGAIIVKRQRIISTGYNGAPAGRPGCLTSGACPRGKLTHTDVAPGSSYDTGSGACIAVHAEQNAILRAGVECIDAAMYVTHVPCDGCSRLIEGSGIIHVIFPGGIS
jgi:dCMP deaminase